MAATASRTAMAGTAPRWPRTHTVGRRLAAAGGGRWSGAPPAIRQISCRTFQADDFVLIRQMGGMTVRTRTSGFSFDEDEAPLLGDGKINFYSARFASNVLPQRPMLLKEFTGAAVPLGEEELRAYGRMLGDPGPEGDDGWASCFGLEEGAGEPPLAPLLGSFRSRPVGGGGSGLQGLADLAEEMGATVDLDAVEGARGGGRDAIWLLSRVDRSLITLADYPAAEQSAAPLFNNIAIFGVSLPGGDEPRRHRFIRAVTRGAVAALAWAHRRGLAHRSLSASCFLLSTLDDTEAARVKVRLSNFGLSLAGGGGEDDGGGDAQGRDMRALGITVAELVFSALDTRGPGSEMAKQDSLERILVLKDGDISAFRRYCLEEEAWADAVALLDINEGSGWALLESLLGGEAGGGGGGGEGGAALKELISTSEFFNDLPPLDPSYAM